MTDSTRAVPPIRTAIVDDEVEAREGLRALVGAHPDFQVTTVCANGREALEALAPGQVELLLLDVQMPGLDGFEVLDRLDLAEPPVVVFITAYDRYALDAFDAHALDYVLKPFSDDRLRATLGRASERVRLRRVGRLSEDLTALLRGLPPRSGPSSPPGEKREPLTRLVARSGGQVRFIPVESVSRITAEDYYVRVFSEGRSDLIRDSLKRLEDRLPTGLFVRTHRSAIVNVRRLRRVERSSEGGYEAVLEDGSRVPVARGRLKDVVKAVRDS